LGRQTKMKVVAMIPARAGSKRVPNKNIKPLLGKPLLGYTVEAAANCNQIESVYVNSDSERFLGCCPFFRHVRFN